MRSLLRLSWWQMANSLRATLRDPRRSAALLLAAAFAVWQAHTITSAAVDLPPELLAFWRSHLATIRAGLFLALCLMALSYINQGLSGGVLTFTPSDTAFLFPSPLGRRLVLLAKLPTALGPLLLTLIGEAWLFRAFVWQPLQASGIIHGGGVAAGGAVLLCTGGWLNLAVALELIFGAQRHPRWQKALSVGALVAVAGIALLCWQRGLAGLDSLATSGPVAWLFLPCQAAAQVAAAPLLHTPPPGWVWPSLLLWYGGTLALLLMRGDNYYEAAARGVALREHRREVQRGEQTPNEPQAGRLSRRKSCRLPLFGQGGLALFWAHCAAIIKRPWQALGLPLACGVGGGIAAVWIGRSSAAGEDSGGLPYTFFVQQAVGVYLYGVVFVAGFGGFQQGLKRWTLVRPLPIPAWQAVAAETGAPTFQQSLFGTSLGLTLAVLHPPGWPSIALLLIVILPLGIYCLNLAQFRVALWYPSTADRAQMFVAGVVQFLALGALLLPLSLLWTGPGLLASRHWLSPEAAGIIRPLGLLVGCALIAALLLRWNARAYAAFAPSGEGAGRVRPNPQ